VLLVEDNATNRRVAELFLERAGCEVVLAVDGAEALAVLEKRRFDLVLMDVQMPVMDGLEATRRIRQDIAGGARVPIVGLTASALKEQVEACRAAGMDDVIAKPIERLEAMPSATRPRLAARTGRTQSARRLSAVPGGGEIIVPRFHEVTAGDAVLARGLVETFEHSAVQAFADLESAIERSDFATARRAAHTLVGSSANMGAVRLEAVAAMMEHAAIQQDSLTLRPLVPVARTRLEAALAELKALLSGDRA
jgi:CheY-like chemotaxis protein